MLTRIRLSNFTAFEEADIAFGPGINVFVGANATGKTHVLKMIYTALFAHYRDATAGLKLSHVFRPNGGDLSRLVRCPANGHAHIFFTYRNESDHESAEEWAIGNGKSDESSGVFAFAATLKNRDHSQKAQPVYVPVKETLAAPEMLAIYEARELDIEDVYIDIIKQAFLPPLRELPDKDKALLSSLGDTIGGPVVERKNRFYVKEQGHTLEFPLVAEGIRKLGLIWRLIQNGVLAKGSVLFWDEPEANLNPALVRAVVEVLRMLQREGIQIFVATHSYVFLKELELGENDKETPVRYHHFKKTDKGDVTVESVDTYAEMGDTAITSAYDALYDRIIDHAMGRNA